MREMVGGCCVCSDERGWDENPLVYCDGTGCNVAVHQACYGIVSVPTGPWFCRKCESQERSARVRCELCPSRDGALKRTDTSSWAHVVCALYIPEVRFGNVSTMEPIVLGLVPQDRYIKTCYLCERQGRENRAASGACMQCNRQGCKQSFHVTCAQSQGLLCEEAGNYMDNVKYCGYCDYHYQRINKKIVKTIPAFKPIPASPEPATANNDKEKDKGSSSSSSSSSGSSSGKKNKKGRGTGSGGGGGTTSSSSTSSSSTKTLNSSNTSSSTTTTTTTTTSSSLTSSINSSSSGTNSSSNSGTNSSSSSILSDSKLDGVTASLTSAASKKDNNRKTDVPLKKQIISESKLTLSLDKKEDDCKKNNSVNNSNNSDNKSDNNSNSSSANINASGSNSSSINASNNDKSMVMKIGKSNEGSYYNKKLVSNKSSTSSSSSSSSQFNHKGTNSSVGSENDEKKSAFTNANFTESVVTPSSGISAKLFGGSSTLSSTSIKPEKECNKVTTTTTSCLTTKLSSSSQSSSSSGGGGGGGSSTTVTMSKNTSLTTSNSNSLINKKESPIKDFKNSSSESIAAVIANTRVSVKLHDFEKKNSLSSSSSGSRVHVTPVITTSTTSTNKSTTAITSSSSSTSSSGVTLTLAPSPSKSSTSVVSPSKRDSAATIYSSKALPNSNSLTTSSSSLSSVTLTASSTTSPSTSSSYLAAAAAAAASSSSEHSNSLGSENLTTKSEPIDEYRFSPEKITGGSSSIGLMGGPKRSANGKRLGRPPKKGTHVPMNSLPTTSLISPTGGRPADFLNSSQQQPSRSPTSSPELESASSLKKKRKRENNELQNGTSGKSSISTSTTTTTTTTTTSGGGNNTLWMMGATLNPGSNVAKEMGTVLQNEIIAHSAYDISNHKNHIGVPFPGKRTRLNKSGGENSSSSSSSMNSSSNPSGTTTTAVPSKNQQPQTLDELLERQWEQGSQFLMDQASHFDIASLLSSLHQLKEENGDLEDSVDKLVQRRDHLLTVRARLLALSSTTISPERPVSSNNAATVSTNGPSTQGSSSRVSISPRNSMATVSPIRVTNLASSSSGPTPAAQLTSPRSRELPSPRDRGSTVNNSSSTRITLPPPSHLGPQSSSSSTSASVVENGVDYHHRNNDARLMPAHLLAVTSHNRGHQSVPQHRYTNATISGQGSLSSSRNHQGPPPSNHGGPPTSSAPSSHPGSHMSSNRFGGYQIPPSSSAAVVAAHHSAAAAAAAAAATNVAQQAHMVTLDRSSQHLRNPVHAHMRPMDKR